MTAVAPRRPLLGPRMPATALADHALVLMLALFVEVGVRVLPLDRLARLFGVELAQEAVAEASAPATPPLLTTVERRRGRAVRRTMRHWPTGGGTCLRESLLHGHVLRGRSPRLHLGARLVDGRISAHAWLSCDGTTVGYQAGFFALSKDGG